MTHVTHYLCDPCPIWPMTHVTFDSCDQYQPNVVRLCSAGLKIPTSDLSCQPCSPSVRRSTKESKFNNYVLIIQIGYWARWVNGSVCRSIHWLPGHSGHEYWRTMNNWVSGSNGSMRQQISRLHSQAINGSVEIVISINGTVKRAKHWYGRIDKWVKQLATWAV